MTNLTHPVLTTQMHVNPEVIDLGIGQPQESLLPLQTIRSAAEICLASGKTDFLQYGAEQGNGYLRMALSNFLSQGYGYPLSSENFFITNGASQALDLICTLFTKPGDVIFVEEPTYFLALKLFSDHGLKTVGIPVDENGLDLEILEIELRKHQPTLFYTIPTFQNPSGLTLPYENRERLAVLSKKHNFVIIADEVYHLLHLTEKPPLSFAGFLDQGNIISLGSFSKILAPGLRLGWIITSLSLIKKFLRCGLLDSGGGLNPFTSAIVHQIIVSNELARHIDNLRSIYMTRSAVLNTALTRYLPDVSYQIPAGGYFFWVRLPGGINAKVLLKTAEKYKVSYRPGEYFSHRDGLRDFLRLCFAFYETDLLTQGIQRLQQAIQKSS